MQLHCTTPLLDCVCETEFLFCFFVRLSDIVLSFVKHCGRLILDFVETIEYCQSREGGGGGRGYGRVRAFLCSLTLWILL